MKNSDYRELRERIADGITLRQRRGLLHVQRAKNGTPSVQPLGGIELRALRKLKRQEVESRFVFMTERTAPITTAGYRKMIARTGETARFAPTLKAWER